MPLLLSGRENLCDRARFTGYDIDGGYAELAVADERFCFPLPPSMSDEGAAPLLCAGLIGYRALRLLGDAERVGLYGFGASAHILCQVAVHQGRRVFAFTREGDEEGQRSPASLGAEWAGASGEAPPEELDGAIVFAPVGALMTAALRVSAKGARIVSAGIHMSDIPSFPYEQLWGERTLGSVANLTRRDGEEFLALAPQVPVRTEVEVHPLEAANEALASIRDGSLNAAAPAVLRVPLDFGRGAVECRRTNKDGHLTGTSSAKEVLVARAAEGRGAGAVVGADVAVEAADRSPPGRGSPCRGRGRRRPPPRRRSRSGSPPARGRSASARPRQSSSGAMPAQPIATSAWPRRQARPKLSATITAGAAPAAARISARMRRAEASGSSGSSATVSASARLELSTPALAQTKPWWVSTISTPRSARSTSRLSLEDQLDQRRLLAEVGGESTRLRARDDRGEAPDPPLGLGDDLLRDDDDVAVARALRGRRSRRRRDIPGSNSGRPSRRAQHLQPAHMPSALAVRRARSALARELAGQGDDVGRRVEVERQRGQLLDREGDARLARGGDVALAAALAEGGLDRRRRGEDEGVGAGAVAVGDDRDVARRDAGEQPVELARVEQRAVAGQEDDALRAVRFGAGDPGQRGRDVPLVGGVGQHLADLAAAATIVWRARARR